MDKRIVMIIAIDNFRDEELFVPLEIFKSSGFQVDVASTDLKQAHGVKGAILKPDMLYSDIDVNDYQAVVFVGGAGSACYFNDSLAHRIVKEAVDNNKVLGAICISPATLAYAGVLEGKKATVFGSEKNTLISKGAEFIDTDVVQDGLLVTASGPAAAEKFGRTIVTLLK